MSTFFHTKYDAYFNKLVALLEDGDSFDADLLEDADFEARLGEVQIALKRANRDLQQSKRRFEYLNTHLFVAVEATRWIIPQNFLLYLELWDQAVADGFLPDCVCREGPTPNLKWDSVVSTPIKSVGKRAVAMTPAGVSVSFANTATPGESPSLTYIPPPVGVHPVPPTPVAVPVNPSQTQVTDAVYSFLQGGSAGSALPVSNNPGTLPSPTPFPPLPVLSTSPNPWVALATQPIYDLNKFHQSYVETEDKFVLNADGTISARKTGRKISTAQEWFIAAHNLGQAMAGSPEDHQFVWSEFVMWIDSIVSLFNAFLFQAVIEYEKTWRRWRRSNRQPWSAVNHSLRDLLNGKGISFTRTPVSLTQGKTNHGTVCNDFSRSACSRLANCRYVHRCKRCNTTFPSTSASCPCVAGALPQGVTLPPGVTFGK